jgi:malate dehydrogenase (oxaloacetate-decarboxylating)(NADP+)
VFAEGEEEKTIRAAIAFRASGYGIPILVESEPGRLAETVKRLGLELEGIEVRRARDWHKSEQYAETLYNTLQRRGALLRDCHRQVQRDRNVFAASMVAAGDADAMVTGLTRNYWESYSAISRVIPPAAGKKSFGMMLVIHRNKTYFIADTSIHELPEPDVLAQITIQTAAIAERMGYKPRAALLSFSTFGNPMRARADRVRETVAILDKRKVNFEYDGEMAPDVALNPDLLKLYPFCRLTDTANILVMPALHTAHISSKLLQAIGGGTVVGPLLVGMEKPVQIVQMSAGVSDIVMAAAFAAYDSQFVE